MKEGVLKELFNYIFCIIILQIKKNNIIEFNLKNINVSKVDFEFEVSDFYFFFDGNCLLSMCDVGC